MFKRTFKCVIACFVLFLQQGCFEKMSFEFNPGGHGGDSGLDPNSNSELPYGPSEFNVRAISPTSVELSWSPSGRYHIVYQEGREAPGEQCTSGTVIPNSSASATNQVLNGLAERRSYTFRICEVNSAGLVSTGKVSTVVTPLGPPPAPLGLIAQAVSASQINVSFQFNGDRSLISRFKLAYRPNSAPTSCAGGIENSDPDATAFAVQQLTANTLYFFGSCAVNIEGIESPMSGTTSVRTLSGAQAAPNEILTTPAFAATVLSTSQIQLNWISGGGTTAGFVIKYLLGATTPANQCTNGTLAADIPATPNNPSMSQVVSNLSPGQLYSFRVCAKNGDQPPLVSNGRTVAATTQALQAVPSDPSHVSVTMNAAQTTATLNWQNEGTTTAGFRVCYQSGNTPPAPRCASGTVLTPDLNANQLGVSVPNLTPNTTYSFRISAFNSNMPRDYSAGATITQTPPPLTVRSIFDTRCVSCHNGTVVAGLDWRVATDANFRSAGLVLARDPAGSRIYQRITAGPGAPMPQGASYPNTLPAAEIETIRVWIASMMTLGVPPAPTGLVAQAVSESQVNVSFQFSGDRSTIVRYKLAYQTNSAPTSCAGGLENTDPNASSFAVRQLTANTLYFFGACAVNSEGTESPMSVTTSTRTLVGPQAPPNEILANPALAATVLSTSQIQLNWVSGGGTTAGFVIKYLLGTTSPANQCTNGTLAGDIPAVPSQANMIQVISNLNPGQLYSFRVCAKNGDQPPLVSNGRIVSATTQNRQAIPADPSHVSVTMNSAQTVATLSWQNEGSTTAGFRVCYQTGATPPAPRCTSGTVLTPDLNVNQVAVSIPNLTPNSTYSFRISAFNSNNPADFSTGATITRTPTALTAQSIFESRCVSCHNGSVVQGIDWRGATDASFQNASLVVAQNPTASKIYQRITNGPGTAMPQGASYPNTIPAAEIETIRLWIVNMTPVTGGGDCEDGNCPELDTRTTFRPRTLSRMAIYETLNQIFYNGSAGTGTKIFTTIKKKVGTFGSACNIYESRFLEGAGAAYDTPHGGCDDGPGNVTANPFFVSNTPALGLLIQACSNVTSSSTQLSTAVANAGSQLNSPPTDLTIRRAFELFHRGEDAPGLVVTRLLRIASSAGTASNAWKYVFFTLCTSPSWLMP